MNQSFGAPPGDAGAWLGIASAGKAYYDLMQALSARLGLSSTNPVAEGIAAYSKLEETLAGRADQLKESTIGIEVFAAGMLAGGVLLATLHKLWGGPPGPRGTP